MKKIPLILLAVAFAVSNAVAQTNNSGADQPATTGGDQKPKDDKAPAKQDPGIRKLSRRERKERIKSLGEKYRPCPLLVQHVEAGRLGKKVGRGVYDY